MLNKPLEFLFRLLRATAPFSKEKERLLGSGEETEDWGWRGGTGLPRALGFPGIKHSSVIRGT